MEQQYFIGEGDSVFALLYTPDTPNGRAVIGVHPFGEEKKSSQRTLVSCAQTLREEGMYVLLIDLQGAGDSKGNLSLATLDRWCDDIGCAVSFLQEKSGCSQLAFLGIRLGAFVSSLYILKNKPSGLFRTVWVEPVSDPLSYLKKLLRDKQIKELMTSGEVSSSRNALIENLDRDQTIDFNGYPLTGSFYKSLLQGKEFMLSHPDSEITGKYRYVFTGKSAKRRNDAVGADPEASSFLDIPPFWNQTEDVDTSALIELVKRLMV